MDIARDGAENVLGHKLSRFDSCGLFAASADCTRPGCNMGLTVRIDGPGWAYAVLGSAITYPCASPERALHDPAGLMYLANPPEGE